MLPIMLVAIACIVGVIWGLYLSIKLSVALFVCFFILAIVFKNKISFDKFLLLISIFFTFAIMAMYTNYRENIHNSKYKDSEISFTCEVVSNVTKNEYYDIYTVRNQGGDLFYLHLKNASYDLGYGAKFTINGQFKLPQGLRNRGGTNYKRYLNSKNIYGIISADERNITCIGEARDDFIQLIRNTVIKTYKQILPPEYSATLLGMVIGETSEISDEVYNNFKESGVTHILAVSGSNIAYLILAMKFLLNKLVGKGKSNTILIAFIVIFTFVSGLSSSVLRAGIMAILCIIADMIYRKPNVLANLSLASIILLIYNPLCICDVGFILSFLGTLGIVLFNSKVKTWLSRFVTIEWVLDTLSVTISAQVILVPVMMYYFNTISVLSIITNLIIVPLAGVITILGFSGFAFGLISLKISSILGYSVYILLMIVLKVSEFISNIEIANLTVVTPTIFQIVLYYFLLWNIFFNKRYKKVITCITFIMIISTLIMRHIPDGNLKVNFVDVGQGDCTFIETPRNKTILIDGGGSENSDYDVGEKVVIPYILDRGYTKIDFIIISHPHDDHIEGVISVINKLKVEKLVVSEKIDMNDKSIELINIAKEKGVEIIYVLNGDNIKIDDVYINIMLTECKSNNINNNSLVLKISYKGKDVLFTGDIESEAEKTISQDITADVLKVAHHGSKTSSSEGFLRSVNPGISVISVGENFFGHPNFYVVERLKKYGYVFSTKECGEINLIINFNGEISIKCLNNPNNKYDA